MSPQKSDRVAVYALTPQGAELSRMLHRSLEGSELFLPTRLTGDAPGESGFERISLALAENFARYSGHVVFGATGIVVRSIAPLLQHKTKDPAVVVCDQAGRFCISLLSGHLGGGNRLAGEVAAILGAQPVITTATDLAGLPSLEMLARNLDMGVENIPALAGVSGALLEGRKVGLWDPAGWLWPHLGNWHERFVRLASTPSAHEKTGPLVWVDWRGQKPARSWLVIRPRCLAAGMGCRRGATAEEIKELLHRTLTENNLSLFSLDRLASIEAKSGEAGLLEAARELNLKTEFFGKTALNSVEAPNPSARVEEKMGVKSVCEAAAILASKGGKLLAEKTKSAKATCAVALIKPGDVSIS